MARKRAAALPGATISGLFYEQWELPGNYFDALTLIHVLDHLVDPTQVLRKAWAEIKPGGIIFAVVHDIECLLGEVDRRNDSLPTIFTITIFSRNRLYENCWRSLDSKSSASTGLGTAIALASSLRGARIPWEAFVIAPPSKTAVARWNLTIPIGNIGIVARKRELLVT